jgi:catechol 2,3-dioxygenase-like lactoylglutathione lyase family enzyme
MIVGLHHASITTADLTRLTSFYREHLGFELVMETQWGAGNADADAIFGLADTAVRMAMLRHANCFLELFEFAAPIGDAGKAIRPVCDQGITHICIAVTDIDAEYARLVAAGMRFNCTPREVPGLCRATYGHDPDGNIVELMEIDPAGPFAFGPAA